MTDLGDVGRILLGDRERRLGRDRPVDEQPHRVRACERRQRRLALRVGNEQRRERVRRFAADVQPLAARREDLQALRRLQQLRGQLGARADQVLAVVEDQQRRTWLEEAGGHRQRRALWVIHQAERCQQGLIQPLRVGEWRQVYKPHAI